MERWAHEDVLTFAQSWGAVYFTLLFVIAFAYAWWPANRPRFDQAAQIPLKDEDV